MGALPMIWSIPTRRTASSSARSDNASENPPADMSIRLRFPTPWTRSILRFRSSRSPTPIRELLNLHSTKSSTVFLPSTISATTSMSDSSMIPSSFGTLPNQDPILLTSYDSTIRFLQKISNNLPNTDVTLPFTDSYDAFPASP